MKLLIAAVALVLGACAVMQTNKSAPVAVSGGTPISDIAANSSCSTYNWKNRGVAPKAYIRGMALVYAKAVCNPQRPDVMLVGAAKTNNDLKDALSWYNSNFKSFGMNNDTAGLDTLRHAYTLLIGLGMRESSGQYCAGRDMSANFTASDSAEAGLFQASWGAARASSELPIMFAYYKNSNAGCLSDVFSQGIKCSTGDLKNWGTGDGAKWQEVTKACPAFAAEYASVLLRTLGGTKGEFGPLRRKEAEIVPACDSMLKQVQDQVTKNPSLCKDLK